MGAYAGKSKPKASISAKVFDKDGKLIADLGEIVGNKKKSLAEILRVRKLRKQLKDKVI